MSTFRFRHVSARALLLLALALVLGVYRGPAQAATPEVSAAKAGLQAFARAADLIASAQQVTRALPLSSVSPGAAMELDRVLSNASAGVDSIGERLAGAGDVDYGDIEDALDGLESLAGLPAGYTITVDGPTSGTPLVADNPADANLIDVVFKLTLRYDGAPVPFSFSDKVLDLSGGTLDPDVTLSTPLLHFQVDKAQASSGDPNAIAQSFWLRTLPDASVVPSPQPPAFTLDVEGSATLPAFNDSVGFADISVSGSATFDISIRAAMVDPDDPDDARITADELGNTALEDLFTMSVPDDPATDALDGTISIDTTLVPGTPDATVKVVDNAIDGTPPSVMPSYGELANLATMDAGDALAAVRRLGTLLSDLQATGKLDVDLPFLEKNFDDVLDVKRRVDRLVDALTTDDVASTVTINEGGRPEFDSIAELATLLDTELNLPGTLTPSYDTGKDRLSFTISLGDDTAGTNPVEDAAQVSKLNFGNLDVLSGVTVGATATARVDASYAAQLTFGLDLSPLPVEDNGGPRSCLDGIDNATPPDGIDAADPDCASLKTVEQRTLVDVGTVAGTPELTANVSAAVSMLDASARIGILSAAIDDATLAIGSGAREDGTAGASNCFNGTDDDGDGKTDAIDPQCVVVALDLVETPRPDEPTPDGILTIAQILNLLGAAGSDVLRPTVNTVLDGTLPVSAALGGTTVGSATVNLDSSYSGPLTGLTGLGENLVIDTSALRATPLFDFSPCDNTKDDDGDGTANDGCPTAGAPAAVDDPETVSTGLLDQIVAAVRALAGSYAAAEDATSGDGDTADKEIPLLGTSFQDLLGVADLLDKVATALETPSEANLGAALGLSSDLCAGEDDDDFDGVANDGCPAKQNTNPPTADPVPEEDCLDSGDTTTAQRDDDGDGSVNDGCRPASPSLQSISASLSKLLDAELRRLDLGDDVSNVTFPTPTSVQIQYVPSSQELKFVASVNPALEHTTAFNLSLDDLGAGFAGRALGSLETSGDVTARVGGDLDIGFGLQLTDFRPFLLDSSKLAVTADALGENLRFDVGIGPITAGVGTDTAVGETDCANDVDDDLDGFVDDGAGETCDTPAKADKGRAYAGAKFSISVPDVAGDKLYFSGAGPLVSFTPDFGGLDTPPAQCASVGAPGAKDACAVLPLYFEDVALGDGDPVADHHLTAVLPQIETLSGLDISYPGQSALLDKIAGQVIDLLLVNTGLDKLLETLERLLSGELLNFKLPLVGDQLAEASQFVGKLRGGNGATGLLSAFQSAMSGGNPLDGVVTAGSVNSAVGNVATQLGNALSAPSVGLLRDGPDAGTDVTAADFTYSLRCGTAETAACDLGGEDDGPANPALAPAFDAAANCGDAVNNDDDDGDGTKGSSGDRANDGCPQVGDTGETGGQCNDLLDADGDGKVNDGCPAVAAPASQVTEVRFTPVLGKTADLVNAPTNMDFDSGVPGLGLGATSTGALTVSGGFELRLGLGISKAKGFFVDVSPDEELVVEAAVKLPDTFSAKLGFLRIDVVDGSPAACSAATAGSPCNPTGDSADPKSTFGPRFEINLRDPGTGADADGRLTFEELVNAPSFDEVVDFDFNVTADVNLHIETSISDDASLPRLKGDLHIDWVWAISNGSNPAALAPTTEGACGGGDCSSLRIYIDDVVLDAGTFISKFIAPVVGEIQKYTKPLDPVIKVATTPIPVLSDFAGEPVTLLTLAETFGTSDIQLIVALVKLVNFINNIELGTDGDGNLTIPIGDGSFELAGKKLQGGELASTDARSAFKTPGDLDINDSLLTKIDQKLQTANGKPMAPNGDVKTGDGLKSIGLSFPFLEQPGKLLGLLFKQDVDLILFRPPGLKASFSYSQKFGPIWSLPPVFLEIGGSASIEGRIGLGYDTEGLREVLFDGAAADTLLHGLFLEDKHGGQDLYELELRGELFANAQVSVLIFSAGAQGSIFTTIGVDLQDPNGDGRLKYGEVADILSATGNPLCLFRLAGELGVRISVFAEVDLFFWSQRWEKTLAEVILFKFSVQCDPAKLTTPDLALAVAHPTEAGQRALRLNVGAFRAARGANSIGKDITDENWTVIKELDGSITVSALGITENEPGPFHLVIVDGNDTGADGNDVITLADGTAGAENNLLLSNNGKASSRCTGSADDDGDGAANDGCPAVGTAESGPQCSGTGDEDSDGSANDGCPTVDKAVPFDVPSSVKLGTGNDKFTGSHAKDTVTDLGGNDQISVRAGNDDVNAGGGDDKVGGGEGNDTITGGTGKDTLDGESGSDTLKGQAGDDRLNGGLTTGAQAASPTGIGAAQAAKPDLNDFLYGGSGVDVLDGGPDADTLVGGAGADTINGGEGGDFVYGNAGPGTETDRDFSAPDADADAGETACAAVNARVGDIVTGGPGADTIRTGAGDDIAIGGSLISGQADDGDPLIDAGAGCDHVFGDNATVADAANRTFNLVDPAIGGGDTIAAGEGDDLVHGQTGGDVVTGSGGADTIFGEAGGDVIDAGDGTDVVDGMDGDDDLIGGDGADVIEGRQGADVMLGDRGSVNRALLSPTSDAGITLSGGTGTDTMHGGSERDLLYGQAGVDTMFGDGADDDLFGGTGDDVMRGGTGADYMFGNDGADDVFGESGADRMVGGSREAGTTDAGLDQLYGGTETDVMLGDNGSITPAGVETLLDETTKGARDELYGELDADRIFGELGNDLARGGQGDDYIEGNADNDSLFGETGQDDVIGGGSKPGIADGDDVISGGMNADYLAGDNALVRRSGGASNVAAYAGPDGAVARTVTLHDLDGADPALSGTDTIDGNESNDRIYGGGETDTIHGNGEEDFVEGNGGADVLSGDAGQDDLVGGTSIAGTPDADDTIHGDADADVVAGDNARITRTPATDNWLADNLLDDPDPARDVLGLRRRTVALYDVEVSGAPAATGVSAGDRLFGDGATDVLYGQGGGDRLEGGAADDYLEGNAGADFAYGQGGQDDLVGGTGRTDTAVPASATDGRLDGHDELFGGDGAGGVATDDFDVIVGDNATVLRGEPGEPWERNTFNASIRREVSFFDVATTTYTPLPGTGEGDLLRGEADDDGMWGQTGGDDMAGGAGDDYMEGNDGADTMLGETGNDDMLGGTGLINGDTVPGTPGRKDAGETVMRGGDGFDVMTGDNAVIQRVLSDGAWVLNTFNGGVAHELTYLIDVNAPAADGVAGGDLIRGDAQDDVIYGQGGDDTVHAGTGEDYAEGNADADLLHGDAGEDDLVGGTGRIGGDGPDGADGRLDGDDRIFGESDTSDGTVDGDGGDVIVGDNAVIRRPLTDLPAGDWIDRIANGVVSRVVVLRDVEDAGAPAVSVDLHGDDVAYGNDNDDVIYGQGGDDEIHGGAGDDYAEGNHAADVIFGDGEQDDLLGGGFVANRLDGADRIYGGAAADFELGDNGVIDRPIDGSGHWTYFLEYNPTTVERTATRHDVGGPAGTAGADYIQGDGGDDYQWGQDGDDTMHGNADNDDMYGELGNDSMFGGEGEDAMVGDRGRITDTKIVGDSKMVSFNTQGPAFFSYTGLRDGQLDRRVSLTDDGDGAPFPAMGIDTGGADRMRGGPGHDSMHGSFGDDLMNGDSGGDWMFGADGADVMWGGKGSDGPDPIDRGVNDSLLDYLFGGHGGTQPDQVQAADILDYLPRAGTDPAVWFEMTSMDDADPANDQHHQGIDWIYGGKDRDVLQGDVGKNGPEFGDRLIDWKGAFNLYTRCNASYGDDGDIRQQSPAMFKLLEIMAYGSGAGESLADVQQQGTSGFREAAIVYHGNGDNGVAFPTTPGHFQTFACQTGPLK